MYKLCVYIPESHLEQVKSALFEAGAGKVGNYERCCWQSVGQGQFCPVQGSEPFIGQHNKLETVAEYKVEMVCADNVIKKVAQCLHDAHPYEEPAYDFIKVASVDDVLL